MTKMTMTKITAAMSKTILRFGHIFQNIKIVFSPEPKADDLETWNTTEGSQSTTKCLQMMILGWPWPFDKKVKFTLYAFIREKAWTIDF